MILFAPLPQRDLEPPVLRPILAGTTAFADKRLHRPKGVLSDLERMVSVCQTYGAAHPVVLSGEGVARSSISTALTENAAAAKAGDVCLFYFSGLGSTAKDGTASLVPYDAVPDSGSNDLPLALVAQWATAVKAAGARPVAILDACWPNEADVKEANTKEWHPYDPTPRYVNRGRAITEWNYAASGVLLAAGGLGDPNPEGRSGRHAYDWQPSVTSWCGAFTDLVGQAVATAGLRHQKLSPQKIFDVVKRAAEEQAEFKYMADFSPSIAGEDLDAPLLDLPPVLNSGGKPGALMEAEQKRSEKYNVALEVQMDDEATPYQKSALYQTAKARFKEGIQSLGEDVVVATGNQRPDMVLVVKPGGEEEKVVFVLPRDEMRARIVPLEYSETSLGAMLPWIERQALLTRLFRLAELGFPTLPGEVRSTLPTKVTRADKMKGDVTPPASSLVLTMDRGEKMGVVHLYTPRARSIDATGSATQGVLATDPALGYAGSTLGPHEWRVLVIEKTPGLNLPSLPTDGVDPSVVKNEFAKARVAFDLATIPYLRAVLDAVQSGQARWTRLIRPYNVEHS